MPILMAIGTLVGRIFAQLGTYVTVEVAKWSASRAMILFLFGIVLPVLLYNIACNIVHGMMEATTMMAEHALEGQTGGTGAFVLSMELVGFAGWICNQIYLPEAFSSYLVAIQARFIMGLIPGLK